MRHLSWHDCYNIRDVGGYAIGDGWRTRWRAVVRADSLSRLNPAGRQALIDYGVRTIIDLRSPSELSASPYPFPNSNDGIPAYFNLPLLDESDREGMRAHHAASSILEIYRLYIDRYAGNIAICLRAIADAAPGCVLVHCHAGKDRTGVVTALLLSLAGVPRTTIAEDYAASDLYLQPLYLEALARANRNDGPSATEAERPLPQGSLQSLPETILAALSYIDQRYAGVPAYLDAAGLSLPEMTRLRERLRQTDSPTDSATDLSAHR